MNLARPHSGTSGESCARCANCPAKMRSVLLVMLLSAIFCFSWIPTGRALQIVHLQVPSIVDPRWDAVSLKCEYDLEGEDLYSVKWYKGVAEFFRYMPGSRPAGRDFPVEGVYVDVNRSDSKQVTLLGQANYRKGKVNLTGVYGCEVSSEGPNFLTAYDEANLTVAILPKEPPSLYGLRPSYEAGDSLDVECTSAPSFPPALLTFILNGKKVNRGWTKEISSSEGELVSSSRQALSLRLERHHFPGGSLSLLCQASLPGIPSARALKTIETATLAASNQRLAQEPPRSGCATKNPLLSIILPFVSLLILFSTSSSLDRHFDLNSV